MYDFDGGIYSETIRELKRTRDTWRRYAAFYLFRQYTVKFNTIWTSYHRLKSLRILKNSVG